MTGQTLVKVGMADLNIAMAGEILKTTGLGSCVALTLFDPGNNVAGMAHVMLPTVDIARISQINVAKFADTAIPELVDRMLAIGARLNRLEAKMAGGSQMFVYGGSDALRIGPRNVESCTAMMNRYGIPIKAMDTGGNHGRTVQLDSSRGILSIKSVQFGVKEI